MAKAPGAISQFPVAIAAGTYDTFVARWKDRTVPDAYVTFALEADSAIRDVRLKPVSPLADFSYDFQDLLFTPGRPPAP